MHWNRTQDLMTPGLLQQFSAMTTASSSSPFQELPEDVLRRLLAGVPFLDHGATAAACRAFRAVIKGSQFLALRLTSGPWRSMSPQNFGTPRCETSAPTKAGSSLSCKAARRPCGLLPAIGTSLTSAKTPTSSCTIRQMPTGMRPSPSSSGRMYKNNTNKTTTPRPATAIPAAARPGPRASPRTRRSASPPRLPPFLRPPSRHACNQ